MMPSAHAGAPLPVGRGLAVMSAPLQSKVEEALNTKGREKSVKTLAA